MCRPVCSDSNDQWDISTASEADLSTLDAALVYFSGDESRRRVAVAKVCSGSCSVPQFGFFLRD